MDVLTAETGNANIRYIKFGRGGRDLIIIPGISAAYVTDSSQAVASAYGAFENDYTVYLFDRKCSMEKGYTMRQMAEDTCRAAVSLGIKEAFVFGASQGGMLGMYMAIDHPDFVKKLALASTASRENPCFEKGLYLWEKLAKEENYGELAQSLANTMYSESLVKELGRSLTDALTVKNEEEKLRLIRSIEAIHAPDIYKYTELITCPTFVFGAEGDRVFGPDSAISLAEELKCGSFIYGPEYGHAVYDEAEDFKQRLLEFFRE